MRLVAILVTFGPPTFTKWNAMKKKHAKVSWMPSIAENTSIQSWATFVHLFLMLTIIWDENGSKMLSRMKFYVSIPIVGIGSIGTCTNSCSFPPIPKILPTCTVLWPKLFLSTVPDYMSSYNWVFILFCMSWSTFAWFGLLVIQGWDAPCLKELCINVGWPQVCTLST